MPVRVGRCVLFAIPTIEFKIFAEKVISVVAIYYLFLISIGVLFLKYRHSFDFTFSSYQN